MRIRDLISVAATYAWFVVAGKLLYWYEPAFLDYDGPSHFLQICVKAGFCGYFVLAMVPVALVYIGMLPREARTVKSEAIILVSMPFMLAFLCVFITVGMMLVALIIGLFSEDAAENFLLATTVIRDG